MEILERLTPRQAQFVREYVTGGNAAEAARRAGYSERTAKAIACELLTKPDLQEAIQALQAENAAQWDITRKDVITGVLEAVAMARAQGEPMAMIAGYRELARMMGFNAPEAHRVEVVAPAAASAMLAKLAAMSDTDLAALASGGA
jgi:phage terminase small subunit